MRIGKGVIVFVTGGASGLGEETVRQLHAKGASVAIADMDVERMESLNTELKERFFYISCDVTSEEEVKNAIEKTVAHFGTIHVALASAGVPWPT